MFNPTADHIEELMRARDICMSISDELSKVDYGWSYCETCMDKAVELINETLRLFSNEIESAE